MKPLSHFHTFALSYIILSILIVPLSVRALDISGYYENTFMPGYSDKSDDHLLDASKLRLDFDAGGSEDELEFKGNVNFVAYHSGASFDVTPYLPEYVADTLQSRDIPVVMTFEKCRVFLDNAYLTWRKSGFRLRAGRQQLSWGPAYSSNPTDLFHRKDMLDPTYEKEGVTALRLDYHWGIGGQVAFVIVPAQNINRAGKALRLATHISKIGYDVALTIHHVTDSTSLDPETYNTRYQDRQAVGLDFSGGLLGLGVWFEGNYNQMEIENDFTRAVAGIDYTLENGLYMMFEGLYDGRADSDKTPYPVVDWLENIYFGEPVTRYRFLSGVRKDLTDLVNGSLYLFGGMDGSMVLNPRIDASIAQNADLTLFGAATFGKKEGQFSPGNFAVTGRIRVYF
ncbi:MAG: hypothetical protein P9X24_04295 [Candidatus Hatepunaea meridiana]|nr:hypothetical protein [Candidatus Hatepunaea meridiana]